MESKIYLSNESLDENQKLFYNKQTFEIPKPYLENTDLLFTEKNLSKFLSDPSQLNKLEKYLPPDVENPKEFIVSLLSNREGNSHLNTHNNFQNPNQVFKNMIKNNYFTKEYQTFLERLKIESLEEYSNLYQKTYAAFKSNIAQYYSNYINQLRNFAAEKGEEIIDSENEAELENNLFDDYASFDTNPEIASSGYTTVLSDNEDNRENNQISSSLKDNKNNIFNNIFSNSADNFSKYNDNESNHNPAEKRNLANKTSNFANASNPFSLNADGQTGDRLNNLKINKNQLTIRPRTKDEIKEFQRQELERYKKPHLPWKYIHPDGSSSVVAPVQKKIPTSGQTKPRDHVLLKSDRPSYVTILCLARDAAARLPEGVGTRADICDLLKDSQYTNERLSDPQINNIVSGALDRLHYEKDPCVKYDLQKKLWIYLHKNRDLDYEPWNEHLKKNNLSNTGEPLNPEINEANKENNIEESYTENKDDAAELNSNYNEENMNEKHSELNLNQAESEQGMDSTSKAGNTFHIFNDVENAIDSEINNPKKSKIFAKADKKSLNSNGNIISITRNFEVQIDNCLNLNDEMFAEKRINDPNNKSGEKSSSKKKKKTTEKLLKNKRETPDS